MLNMDMVGRLEGRQLIVYGLGPVPAGNGISANDGLISN